MLTFGDFIWQVLTTTPRSLVLLQVLRSSSHTQKISRTATARYAVRFFITLLKVEMLINVMHFAAIKDANAWNGMSSA
jgi:D-alanyl-lipoteichoic acid acyltransferase DltB (MBOAT superfamily)